MKERRRRSEGAERETEDLEASPEEPDRHTQNDQPETPSEAAESAEAGPETGGEVPLTERVERELAAEQAFRERVAIRDLADRLPPETVVALERALARQPGTWRLEKGRCLFRWLVAEESAPTAAGAVRIEQRVSLHRDEPPPEPRAVLERVKAVLEEPVADDEPPDYGPIAEILPTGDAVRIERDDDTVVVTRDEVRVEPREPEPASDGPPEAAKPEAKVAAETEIPAEPLDAASVEPASTSEGSDQSTESRPTLSDAEEEVAAVMAEAEEDEAELVALGDAETAAEREPATLGEVIEVLDREAVRLNDLPPIEGGSQELDESEPEPEPPDQPPEPVPPEPQPVPEVPKPESTDVFDQPIPVERESERPKARRRAPRIEIDYWEPGSPEVVRYPDYRMRKKGRKLIRKLARRFGIKLTPDLETYLLTILLRPRYVHGRKVYGLRLNLDRLIPVMRVLHDNYANMRQRGFW